MKPKVALQLYSVRQDCEQDFFGSLKQVKEAGYQGVEFAGYYGKSAAELKACLTELDLEVAGSHIPYDALKDDLEAVLAFEKTIGNENIVCPYINCDTIEEWDACIENLQNISEVVTAHGMKFFYHNHSHEFMHIPGVDIVDRMLQKAETIQSEADLYWLAFAGIDVLDWLKAHEGRVGLLHMKDMQKEPQESTEIGHGILPMKAYVEAGAAMDIPWLIVEQEAFQKYAPMEAAKIDCENLTKLVKEVCDND